VEILQSITDNIQNGNSANISRLIKTALKSGISATDVLNNGLIPGMSKIATLFKHNEIYIPEVLVAAGSMDTAIEILRPLLTKHNRDLSATVIIGTVKGDLHNIGKDLVAIMLAGAGFHVVDLGVDVSPEKFIEQARKHHADIVAMSALLTTTIRMMKIVIDDFRDVGLRSKIKFMIGGAPVTQHFAKLINADGYSEDAATAVDVARHLLNM